MKGCYNHVVSKTTCKLDLTDKFKLFGYVTFFIDWKGELSCSTK